MTSISDVRVAYEEAQGRWSGCTWPTHYGSLGLDLDGVSSAQARQTAGRWRAIAADEGAADEATAGEESGLVDAALNLRLGGWLACQGEGRRGGLLVCGSPARLFCAEALAREWAFAARWLEEIESDARWSQEEAQQAVRAAEEGDWESALGHARRACSIERGYDAPRPWTRLKGAVERAAAQAAALAHPRGYRARGLRGNLPGAPRLR